MKKRLTKYSKKNKKLTNQLKNLTKEQREKVKKPTKKDQ